MNVNPLSLALSPKAVTHDHCAALSPLESSYIAWVHNPSTG
jgi:hypothetical protein